MIYIIHKILPLIKNHLDCLKDSIFECFFKEYNKLLFFENINQFFSQRILMKSSRLEKDKKNRK